jgi:hypothetical protein
MAKRAAPTPATRPGRTAPELPWLAALVAVAAWSIVPPYLGPALGLELDVSSAVEIVDHVVPGVVALAAGAVALALARRGETDSTRALAAVGACALAALWGTASHAPLVLDAGGSERPWGAVLFHALPAAVLLALSLRLLLSPPGGAQAG